MSLPDRFTVLQYSIKSWDSPTSMALRTDKVLLGPLPKPWTMVVEDFYPIEFALYNSEPEEIIIDDPRLGALPEEWEEVEIEDETHSDHALRHYMHRDLGAVIDSDPRMLPDTLRPRGVKLETIVLV
jgi:hypothetical protein